MKSIKLNRESGHYTGDCRLLKLAGILDNVPRKEFNMNRWDCGTTACAAGYACRDPGFRRLGLRLGKHDGIAYPMFNGCCNVTASLAAFFDLAPFDVLYMFMPYLGHQTPKQVAKYIRRFVAKRNVQ